MIGIGLHMSPSHKEKVQIIGTIWFKQINKQTENWFDFQKTFYFNGYVLLWELAHCYLEATEFFLAFICLKLIGKKSNKTKTSLLSPARDPTATLLFIENWEVCLVLYR